MKHSSSNLKPETPIRTRTPIGMPVKTYPDQLQRKMLSNTWEPVGYDRYVQDQARLRSMNMLGGIGDDQMGTNPDRYRAF